MTFSYGFHVRQSEPGAACSSLARFFNVLVRTGLCAIELERANIEDIRNKGAHTVLYVRGKGRGRKDDFVVLTDAAGAIDLRLLVDAKKRGREAPLFAFLSNKTMGAAAEDPLAQGDRQARDAPAGLDDDRLTTHSLRHTAVTLALLGGATLQQAQSIARYTNINTTLVYSHNLDRVSQAASSRWTRC